MTKRILQLVLHFHYRQYVNHSLGVYGKIDQLLTSVTRLWGTVAGGDFFLIFINVKMKSYEYSEEL